MKKKAKTISVKVEISVAKPVKEVFRAVLEPTPFFVGKVSGPMKEGEKIAWEFADFPGGFFIRVRKVVPGELILFEWPRGEGKEMNRVEFRFKAFTKKVTTVYVTESGWPEAESEASYRNCMGWMHMICSLKAYLEYGVNLRKDAFIHMQQGCK